MALKDGDLVDDAPKSDPEKLRILADWFDVYDKRNLNDSNEVQDFLRGLADRLDNKKRTNYVEDRGR